MARPTFAGVVYDKRSLGYPQSSLLTGFRPLICSPFGLFTKKQTNKQTNKQRSENKEVNNCSVGLCWEDGFLTGHQPSRPQHWESFPHCQLPSLSPGSRACGQHSAAIPSSYPIQLSHPAMPSSYPIQLSHPAIPSSYPIQNPANACLVRSCLLSSAGATDRSREPSAHLVLSPRPCRFLEVPPCAL